jgi:hypothetical protein
VEWREALLLKFLAHLPLTGARGELMKPITVLLFLNMLLLTGCGLQPEESVIVAVYPSRQQCGVEQQMMSCKEIAAYLHDRLKLKTDKKVVVSAVGIDPLPKDDTSLNKIAATIKDLGFQDVRTANFDVK